MALVSLEDVWAMLDQCAPGHTREEKTHNWCVRYRHREYPSLPRKYASVKAGHVRQLARALDIVDCAKRFLGDRLR